MHTTIPRIHKKKNFTLATTEPCVVQIHEFLFLQIARLVATIAMDPKNLVEEGTFPTMQVSAEYQSKLNKKMDGKSPPKSPEARR